MSDQVPIPAGLAAQATLFEDPRRLLAMPAGELDALTAEVVRASRGLMAHLRRYVGLLCWAHRQRLPDGPYGEWVAGVARMLGLAPRTLMEWRRHVETREHLAVPAGRRPGPETRRSAERPAETSDRPAPPSARAARGRPVAESPVQELPGGPPTAALPPVPPTTQRARPASGASLERGEVTPLFKQGGGVPRRPAPAPTEAPRPGEPHLDLLEHRPRPGPDAVAVVEGALEAQGVMAHQVIPEVARAVVAALQEARLL